SCLIFVRGMIITGMVPWLRVTNSRLRVKTANPRRKTKHETMNRNQSTRNSFRSAVRMTRHLATQVASVKEKKRLRVKKLCRLEYGAALKLQKETELAVRDGRQPDTLLLLEHPHTLTVGRRGDNAGILMS